MTYLWKDKLICPPAFKPLAFKCLSVTLALFTYMQCCIREREGGGETGDSTEKWEGGEEGTKTRPAFPCLQYRKRLVLLYLERRGVPQLAQSTEPY